MQFLVLGKASQRWTQQHLLRHELGCLALLLKAALLGCLALLMEAALGSASMMEQGIAQGLTDLRYLRAEPYLSLMKAMVSSIVSLVAAMTSLLVRYTVRALQLSAPRGAWHTQTTGQVSRP